MTIIQWVQVLKPAQLWAILSAFAAAIVGAFTLGAKFIG